MGAEAMDLQGFDCTKFAPALTTNGELDVEGTLAEAFGDSAPTDSVGVLVLADGRYLACIRDKTETAGSAQQSLRLRDVIGGGEQVIAAADLAEHVSRFPCL